MHKFSVINFNKRIDILISNTKCIIGNDYESKDLIKKTIIHYFSKLSQSEYAENTYGKSNLLFDDNILNINDYDFYYLNPNFDMDQDVKLGTKSLCLSFVNSLLNNIEYNETFQTISVLLNDMFESLFEDDKENIFPEIDIELTKKNLTKLISFYFMKDDYLINNYDLSLRERVLMQLKMILKISKYTNKNIIIVGEIPIIDEDIIKLLNEIKSFNIIFIEKTQTKEGIDMFIMNSNEIIDIQDEEKIFDLCNNSQNYYDIKGMKEKIYSDNLNLIYIK